MPPSKRLKSIAYHEAGHAVIAWQVKVRIKKLSIIPNEGSLGRLLHHPYFNTTNIACDTSPRSQRRIENKVLVCLSGPAAQRKFNPKGYRPYNARSDHQQAVDLISNISPESEELGAYLRLMKIRARNSVNESGNWYQIEQLAQCLIEKKELGPKAIREIIFEAWKSAP